MYETMSVEESVKWLDNNVYGFCPNCCAGRQFITMVKGKEFKLRCKECGKVIN